MRQIEKDMVDALFAGKAWRGKNTEVRPTDYGNRVVSLHGNQIASLDLTDADNPVLNMTLAGWNTPTTRSRLNAILERWFFHSSWHTREIKTPRASYIVRYAFAQKKGQPVIRAWGDWGEHQVEFVIRGDEVLSHRGIMEKLRELYAAKEV